MGTLLLLGASVQLNASLLIDAGAGSNLQAFTPANYIAGSEFTTTSSFTIRSLGYLDSEGDGLTGSHTVGLWDAGTEALLASVVVNPGSFQVLSAQGVGIWHLADITPIVIGPGTYRVAGSQDTDSNALSDDKIGNGVTLSAGYVRTDFPNGGFAFPNLAFASEAIRATLSTDSVTPTPEPSTLLLGGFAAVGLMFGSRRVRTANAAR
jgi:hypothetical protein